MKSMQICGLGLVGGFGNGKQDLLNALEKRDVPVAEVEVRDQLFPLYQADTSPLETYLNKRALRRIDHFSRLALLGAFQALEDAEIPDLDRGRLGVVIGSGFGAMQTTFKFLDSVLEDGDAFASPTAFSNSVHNAAAAHISMQLKTTGPSLTVSQFDQSLVSGVLAAQQWLDEGRVDAVLLGVVDEYSPVLGYCWERFLGTRRGIPMRPFELSQTTAIAGDGAAFFLLCPAATTSDNYASISEVAMGNLRGQSPDLSPRQPLLLNCDGWAETGSIYQQQLPKEQPVACYTPLYGASPISQGFDLAVAALALKQGCLFPSVAAEGGYFNSVLNGEGQDCQKLSCLRFGPAGDYGVVHLERGI